MIKVHLNIAEIPYDTGEVRYLYARYLSADGKHWIRHGLFRSYYKDGSLASEGHYENGLEEGLWRDYHPNGTLAAEGQYRHGEEVLGWRFWDSSGNESDRETSSTHLN